MAYESLLHERLIRNWWKVRWSALRLRRSLRPPGISLRRRFVSFEIRLRKDFGRASDSLRRSSAALTLEEIETVLAEYIEEGPTPSAHLLSLV